MLENTELFEIIKLLKSYVCCMNFHEALSKEAFIGRLKESYSIDEPRNRAFIESVETYEFVSIERYVDKFKVIYN